MKNNPLIIALPTSDRQTVDGHFGHTKEFVFYTIEQNKVTKTSFVTPPKHEPGVLPQFLATKGAHVIITGGMGAMAVNLFNNNDIDVILGITGFLDDIISQYLMGTLQSQGSVCSHDHDHDHNHGAHHS